MLKLRHTMQQIIIATHMLKSRQMMQQIIIYHTINHCFLCASERNPAVKQEIQTSYGVTPKLFREFSSQNNYKEILANTS